MSDGTNDLSNSTRQQNLHNKEFVIESMTTRHVNQLKNDRKSKFWKKYYLATQHIGDTNKLLLKILHQTLFSCQNSFTCWTYKWIFNKHKILNCYLLTIYQFQFF